MMLNSNPRNGLFYLHQIVMIDSFPCIPCLLNVIEFSSNEPSYEKRNLSVVWLVFLQMHISRADKEGI